MSIRGGDLDDLVRIEDPRSTPRTPSRCSLGRTPRPRTSVTSRWVSGSSPGTTTSRRSASVPTSSREGAATNLKDLRIERVSGDFFGHDTVITTDPPLHRQLRATIALSFSPTAMAGMEATIRAFTAAILDAIPDGVPIDFVEQVAAVLPLKTILTVIGIDPANVAELKHRSDEMMKSGSAPADAAVDDEARAHPERDGGAPPLDHPRTRLPPWVGPGHRTGRSGAAGGRADLHLLDRRQPRPVGLTGPGPARRHPPARPEAHRLRLRRAHPCRRRPGQA